MKAVIYARFSPRRDEAECESIEMQSEHCLGFCLDKGWEIVSEHEDRAMSGADADRPGLWEAVGALSRGSALVVYRFDRLARDGVLHGLIEKECRAKGASIVSATGEGTIDEAMSPIERLNIGIVRLFSEYERYVIKARTSAGMKRHQDNGRRMSRSDRCPYGWKPSTEDDAMMVEDPDEQEVIAGVMEMVSGGMSYRAIAESLTVGDVPTRTGAPWTHKQISNIVKRFKK